MFAIPCFTLDQWFLASCFLRHITLANCPNKRIPRNAYMDLSISLLAYCLNIVFPVDFVFMTTRHIFLGARRLSTPQEHIHSLRGAVGKVGVAGPAWARTCNPKHREASRWFFTSAALCAKTWVLPMELGGSWCYHGPLTGPWWYLQGPQPRVNPPNLGSQTLRLQRGAVPFTVQNRHIRLKPGVTAGLIACLRHELNTGHNIELCNILASCFGSCMVCSQFKMSSWQPDTEG